MARKLNIHCGTCDARNVSEETLSAYESITINCGDLMVTPEAQALLSRYGVAMNCGNTRCLPKDAVVRQINGSHKLTPADVPGKQVYLSVNGSLEIAPGSEAVLERCVGINVNGALLCPESLGSCLQNVSVNGSTTLYPDEAIVLKRTAVIDRLFALRAKERLYWSARRMIFTDPMLDGEQLAGKGATFQSREVIITESLVGSLLGSIHEQVDIIIVPDDTQVLCDDVTLTLATVRKSGPRLCITGDLEITPESREALEQMEYLCVQGDATVPEDMQALLLEKAEIGGILQVRNPFLGRRISDRATLRLSKWLLEQEPHGIWVEDCAIVRVDEDIPNGLILDKLHLVECGVVRCGDGQESALAMVSQDCGIIGKEDADAPGQTKNDPDTVTINAGTYTL